MKEVDPRIAELEQLAHEEGIVLPMAPSLIVGMEDRGYVVDLVSGELTKIEQLAAPKPTIHAKAVAYLLSDISL
jgi:hypothetical protein